MKKLKKMSWMKRAMTIVHLSQVLLLGGYFGEEVGDELRCQSVVAGFGGCTGIHLPVDWTTRNSIMY